jgi:hypothetical protein
MTDIFDDPNTDFATALIGEGKKYADVKLAAKALVDKDNFIEQLKRENAEMRKSMASEAKMDALLDQLKNLQSASSGNSSNGGNQPQESIPNQNPNTQTEALTTDRVYQIMEDRERQRREEQNLAIAVQKAKEAFGANAKSVIENKAAELGMSYEDLINEAKKRPQAFLKLVEANGPVGTTRAPQSQVNTAASVDANGNTKNNAYYAKLRRELKAQGKEADFYKPAVQNEMMRNAQLLGDAFFN